MEDKRILLIGGTGYIGTCILDRLLKARINVSCLVRKKSIRKIEGRSIKYFVGDLLDRDSISEATKGMDIIINLASVVRTVKKSSYRENVTGLQNLVSAMRQNNVNKLIYYSSMNVNLKNKGYYASSKAECENVIKGSGIEYIIIRPNYVYGIDKNNDFYRMSKIISLLRIAPVIGDGNYKIQPVCKDDLAAITLSCLTEYQPNSIIEVSGHETVSINNIISQIEDALGKKALKVRIPLNLVKLISRFVPFDVLGYNEDKISTDSYNFNYASFHQNLNKIVNIK